MTHRTSSGCRTPRPGYHNEIIERGLVVIDDDNGVESFLAPVDHDHWRCRSISPQITMVLGNRGKDDAADPLPP